MSQTESNYTRGFVVGALVGGVAGAITALLLAPKSGAELRKDIADTSTEFYGKASDYLHTVEGQVGDTMTEGKKKARVIIDNARHKAERILADAENVLSEAKNKAGETKENIKGRIDNIRDAAKASAETFKAEMNKES